MRIAFLDEAGRSRGEPIIVVAGIVIHGDRTYRELENRIRAIAEFFIPEVDREEFVFHAKDLFHGTGYFKDLERSPRELRWSKLMDLVRFPKSLGLPVVFGHIPKAEYGADIANLVGNYILPNPLRLADARC